MRQQQEHSDAESEITRDDEEANKRLLQHLQLATEHQLPNLEGGPDPTQINLTGSSLICIHNYPFQNDHDVDVKYTHIHTRACAHAYMQNKL